MKIDMNLSEVHVDLIPDGINIEIIYMRMVENLGDL